MARLLPLAQQRDFDKGPSVSTRVVRWGLEFSISGNTNTTGRQGGEHLMTMTAGRSIRSKARAPRRRTSAWIGLIAGVAIFPLATACGSNDGGNPTKSDTSTTTTTPTTSVSPVTTSPETAPGGATGGGGPGGGGGSVPGGPTGGGGPGGGGGSIPGGPTGGGGPGGGWGSIPGGPSGGGGPGGGGGCVPGMGCVSVP